MDAARIKAMAHEAGLDAAGIAPASADDEALARTRDQIGRGFKPKWDPETIGPFYHPRSEMPRARSVLVAANCYLESGPESLGKPGEPHGRVARYDWSNYYQDTRDRLKKVAGRLAKEPGGSFHCKIFSNGRLAEKPLAARAGVGWYGKHGVITTSEFGSWAVLGLLVTDLELEPDPPAADGCGVCRACVDACPTGAIVEPRIVDSRKCLQWMSGREMNFSGEVRKFWGDRLYGCNICQDACPLNKKARPKDKMPDRGRVGPSLPLIPMLRMFEREYRETYKGNQIAESWVSFGAIQRNAAVALGNIGDPAAVPALAETLRENRSSEVRGHAAWALGRLGGGPARTTLEKALGGEGDGEVRAEMERALGGRGPD